MVEEKWKEKEKIKMQIIIPALKVKELFALKQGILWIQPYKSECRTAESGPFLSKGVGVTKKQADGDSDVSFF